MTTEEFGRKLDEIYAVLKKVLIEKNRSYGSASFQGEGIMPIVGNVVRLKDKMNRYEHLVSKMVNGGIDLNSSEMNPFGESVWDTVQDMVGYSLIGLCILDEKGMGKLPKKEETITEVINFGQIEEEYWQKEYAKKKKGEDPV